MAFGDTVSNFFGSVTTHEVLLFVAIMVLFVILGLFYHFSIVQLRVQGESRCLREANLSGKSGVYNVIAKVYNRPAFEVSYDALAKTTKIGCACQTGDVESTFTNIPYYDLSSTTAEADRVKTKDKLVCSCETNISADTKNDSSKVSYYGEPGIAKFMKNSTETGFFDTIMYGANYEYVS